MSAAAGILSLANAGLRLRSVAELHADVINACSSLGELSAEWRISGFVPDGDLSAVDRTLTGLHRLLIDIRGARAGPQAT